MGFQVTTTGGPDLKAVRRRLRQVGDKGLGKQMSRQLAAASADLRAQIRDEVPKAMPSGYAPVLSKSLRFRQQTKEAHHSAAVTFRIHGEGQRERRDVPALNRGRLRHPVWGRRSRPWVTQPVRKGFVDRPVDRLAPDIGKRMQTVIDHVANQLKG